MTHRPLLRMAALAALALPAPVAAQSLAELDRLTNLTTDEAAGLDLAREQAGRGAYLEALATLERVMAVNPRSPGPQLLHAIYLCWIDDRQGGMVEINGMDEDDFGRDNLADARQQCNSPPPAPAPVPIMLAPPPINTVAPPAPPPPAAAAPGTGSTPASTPAPRPQGGKD